MSLIPKLLLWRVSNNLIHLYLSMAVDVDSCKLRCARSHRLYLGGLLSLFRYQRVATDVHTIVPLRCCLGRRESMVEAARGVLKVQIPI